MTTAENVELSLTCAICLDLAPADHAVETACCHQLFCLSCIETVQACPCCRQKNFQTVPAHFARRLIGSLMVKCPNDGCPETSTRSNVAAHLANHCAFGLVTCPDPQCKDFKCTKTAFVKHLTTTHADLLTENYNKLWQTDAPISGTLVKHDNAKSSARVYGAGPATAVTFDDRLERTRNQFGRFARLGSSGKFYCGGKLDGVRCTCCNGRCGFTNGCNCSACMLLDVQKRQLPHGWLVNREGAAARRTQEEPTKFYCGRKVMPDDSRTDGYCGPTNGEQCVACRTLTEQQQTRYRQIWTQ